MVIGYKKYIERATRVREPVHRAHRQKMMNKRDEMKDIVMDFHRLEWEDFVGSLREKFQFSDL